MHVRLSVTVDPDPRGTILVPSPFAIVPGGDRVVLNVPESGGIFLLERERILHHFPLPDEPSWHDMVAAETFFVVGRHLPSGRMTVDLRVFDLRTGTPITTIASRNPYLRVEPPYEELWRVVIGGSRVGVYHPAAGASYPLWDKGSGPVSSSDQLAGASAGIGFSDETQWIPTAGGGVERRQRGRTAEFADADHGDFVDAVSDRAVLLAPPQATVRADADGDLLLSRDLPVRLLDEDGHRTDFRLRSMDEDVRARRLVIQGRPIRVRGGTIYWIYLGVDYLEIRSAPLSAIGE